MADEATVQDPPVSGTPTVQPPVPQPPVSKGEKLYENLVKAGLSEKNLGGSKQNFIKNLSNPITANTFYSKLRDMGFTEKNLGTLKDFQTIFTPPKGGGAGSPPISSQSTIGSNPSPNGATQNNIPGWRMPKTVQPENPNNTDHPNIQHMRPLPGVPVKLLSKDQEKQTFEAKPQTSTQANNKTNQPKGAWGNIGNVLPMTVRAGLEKDAGDALQLIGGKIGEFRDNAAIKDNQSMMHQLGLDGSLPSQKDYGLTGAVTQLGLLLEDDSKKYQQAATDQPLPNTTMGKVATTAIGFTPDLIELAATPELDVAKLGKLGDVLAKYGGKYAPKAANLLGGKFPILMGTKGLTSGYSEAKAQGMSDYDATNHALINSAEEYGKGVLFEGAGAAAGKVSKLGAKVLEDAGWLKGGKIVQGAQKAILNSAAQATAFSAVPFVTNAIQGKTTSLDEFKNNAIFGGVLGLFHGKEKDPEKPSAADASAAQINQRSPLIDVHNFMAADMAGIQFAHQLDATATDLHMKAAQHAQDAYYATSDEGRQTNMVQSSIHAKLASLKAFTDAISKDKDGVIDGINQLDLPDEDKQKIIDKINKVHEKIDPLEGERVDLDGKLHELNGAIAANEARPATTPKDLADKKVVGERLQQEHDDLTKQLEDATKSQYEAKIAQQETDAKIAEFQKNFPDHHVDMMDDLPEHIVRTFDRIDSDKPVDPVALNEASDWLYNKYKELTKTKTSDTRMLTTEQIEALQHQIGEDITTLENHKAKYYGDEEPQAESGTEAKPETQVDNGAIGEAEKAEIRKEIKDEGKPKSEPAKEIPAQAPKEDATAGAPEPDKTVDEKSGDTTVDKSAQPVEAEVKQIGGTKEANKKGKEIVSDAIDDKVDELTKVDTSPKKLKEQKKDIIDQMQEVYDIMFGHHPEKLQKELKDAGFLHSGETEPDYRDKLKEAGYEINDKDQIVFHVLDDGTFKIHQDNIAYAIDQVKKEFPTELEKQKPDSINKDNKNQKPGKPGTGTGVDPKDAIDNIEMAKKVGNKKMQQLFEKEYERVTGKSYDPGDAENNPVEAPDQTEAKTPPKEEEKPIETTKNKEKSGDQEKQKVADRAKTMADKLRTLKTGKGNTYGGLQGVGAAVWDGAIETVATVIEQGGKLADAIQAAVDHIKANSKEKDEDKIRKAITADFSAAGLEDRYDEPEMIEANNAFMDAKVEGRFGQDALDHIIGQLKDTNLENIVGKVKAKIAKASGFLADTRKRVLENEGGSEEDQAALLMDQYHLKGQEEKLIQSINEETNPDEIRKMQSQLEKLQGEILDNAVANRMIGREASSIFRLRQVAVDQDSNLQNMREQYMASEGVKKLTPEQEEEIRQEYQKRREAEEEVKRLTKLEKQNREKNEKLQQENDALRKIIDDAKAKHNKSKATTSDRLSTIRTNIDSAKKELAKIFSANAFFNPEVYKHLKNIAVGKAEEIYVRTKQAVELNHLIDAVHDEIKDLNADITKEDIRDAIAGRGGEKSKPKSELQKNLQDLKTQAGLMSRINDLENNIEVQTKRKGESSPQVKALQKQLSDLKKQIKIDADTEAMQEGTLDTSVKSVNKAEPDERQQNINRYKAIQRQIKAVEGKLNTGDFTTPAKEAKKFEKSKELQDAEHKLAVRKFQWEKARKQALMKNQPWYKKLANNVLQWQRFAVLSYPTTLAKLAIVAAKGVIVKPLQLAFQELNYRITHAIGRLTGRTGASGAVYGKVRPEAMAKFYGEFVRNFSIQNIKSAFSGMDDADLLYGSSKYMEDYDIGSGFHNAFLEFPGRSHGYIKSFLRKPETAFAHEQLLQHYIEKFQETGDPNYDPSNDETLERINSLAAEHGKWAIMMNKNNGVEKLRTMFNSLMGDNSPSLVTKATGVLLKTEFPILKLPVNYARRYFLTKYGLIKAVTGTGEMPGLIHIALKGTADLTDQQKDLLSRTLTYGSMGAAAVTAGYLLRNKIVKNQDGSVDFGGHHIPKLALDSPLDDSFLSGVTYGQHIDAAQGPTHADDWIKNFATSDIDVAKRMPFVNTLQYGFLTKLAQALYAKSEASTNQEIKNAFDRKVGDMVTPGFLKEIAEYYDKDEAGQPVKRYPKSAIQAIESGIPGLRKNVSTHTDAFDKKVGEIKNDDGETVPLSEDKINDRKKIIDKALSTDPKDWIDKDENRKTWTEDFQDFWSNDSNAKKIAKAVAPLKMAGASKGRINDAISRLKATALQKFLEDKAIKYSADKLDEQEQKKKEKPYSILNQ